MVVRFTAGNWARFKTHGKTTTIRVHKLKYGTHDAVSGSRFKPVKLGRVNIQPDILECLVSNLDELDAEHDGFDSLCELLLELGKLNKEITPNTTVFIHSVQVI